MGKYGALGKPDHEQFFNRAVSQAAYERNEMAKKAAAAAKEEPKTEPTPAPAAEPAPAPAAEPAPAPKQVKLVRPAGIKKGALVFFHRAKNMGYKVEMECWPAIIIGFPDKASNFQEVDGAVNLKVFTEYGDEVRKGVMFAHHPEKREGRWTFEE